MGREHGDGFRLWSFPHEVVARFGIDDGVKAQPAQAPIPVERERFAVRGNAWLERQTVPRHHGFDGANRQRAATTDVVFDDNNAIYEGRVRTREASITLNTLVEK